MKSSSTSGQGRKTAVGFRQTNVSQSIAENKKIKSLELDVTYLKSDNLILHKIVKNL